MKIGPKTIGRSVDLITELLNSHQTDLNEAYIRLDDPLSVNINLKVSPNDKGNKLDVKLSFVADKVSVSADSVVNEEQMEMFQENEDDGYPD